LGRNRLADAVKEVLSLNAREMVASLQRSVLEWTGGIGSNDDATFFVIKALK
jgi:hypothetical protein